MEKRTIASSRTELTALGMGCASLGGLYAPVSAALCIETLEAAWDAGIRYFDAAPMYGLGRAEHMLDSSCASRWLTELRQAGIIKAWG